jgi:hypothetical protein
LSKKLGKANVAVVKATLKQTCILEKEHVTSHVVHVFTPKTGGGACHVSLWVTAGMH